MINVNWLLYIILLRVYTIVYKFIIYENMYLRKIEVMWCWLLKNVDSATLYILTLVKSPRISIKAFVILYNLTTKTCVSESASHH